MQTQTAIDKFTAEARFRVVVSSYTSTGTITAASIAVGSPIILETATNSLPTTTANSSAPFYPSTNIQNFVRRPATATALTNNLFAGILYSVPGANPTYLDREQVGLAQTYGPYVGAIVKRPTSAIGLVGALMIPDSDQSLLPVIGPMTFASFTIASTDTLGLSGTSVPGYSGLAVAMAAIASSSVTETTTGTVFLRCG